MSFAQGGAMLLRIGMSSDPKRPSSLPARPGSVPTPAPRPSVVPGRSGSSPAPGRPGSVPSPSPSARPGTSSRPVNVRDAMREAHALGGGAVGRASAVVSHSQTKKTILLVDADAALRSRLRALLEPQYEVLEAKDGLEAVEMTGAMQPPAMIVCDTALPRLDGFSLAKILRGNPLTKRVPIMFVSAQTGPQHVTQALVIGVSQYVPKTTPDAQIAEKIRKIVL